MLITTPETLQILFTGKRLRKYLCHVRWVVVDEVHELACDERGAQLAVGLERLYELARQGIRSFQRIGLSATVGRPEEVARFLGGFHQEIPRDVSIIEVDVSKHIDIQVEFPLIHKQDIAMASGFSMEPQSFALLRRCKEIIDDQVSTLLFINTRDGAEILASRFHQWQIQYPIGVHHGSLSKLARIESENEFKQGNLKALICTSSLELGIDVGHTDYVLQYNSPREVTRLVQRVGRSGHRVGKTSKGKILASNPEDLAESLVLARRALHGDLEQHSVRQNPLSVLTNQIIAITLEYGCISSDQIYSIIHRAYPFHTLSRDIFDRILQQLRTNRVIWFEESKGTLELRKRMSSRNYFLENISMIPDEKTYLVRDIGSRKIIGTLDESFVLNSVFEGEHLILRGMPWMVVKQEDEEILVSQAKKIGNVPSWVGEDIPVPFEVAQEVGKLRRIVAEGKNIMGYPCENPSLEQFYHHIRNQQNQGFLVPDDKTITVEQEDKTVVINCCFGTKVNETLGRLISALLAQMLGESIGISSDSYRITFELPGRLPLNRIIDIIMKTKPDTLEYLLEKIVRNSTYIRWQLVHVARKFGSLRRDFDSKNIGMKRLFGLFEHSMIFDEAVDKVLWERMDISHTQWVFRKIQHGDIAVKTQRLSPMSLLGFETIRGLMVPQRADRTILMALKKRLEDSDISLVCTNCHTIWDTAVRRAGMQPRCRKCGAIKVAVLRRYQRDDSKLLTKKILSEEEIREMKRLQKNASLVLSYGFFALLALVGRGIGPDSAARVLRKFDRRELARSEEVMIQFLREILRAELQYARTRGFWDS
jgi:ATP-dependent Lhr-like helicase